MADLTASGPQLPFVLGGAGTFTIHVGVTAVGERLPACNTLIFNVSTNASAAKPVSLDAADAWTLSIKADGKFSRQMRYASLTATARPTLRNEGRVAAAFWQPDVNEE